jgi:hypothetical protein
MQLHLKIIGILLILLALIHVVFPRYFNWKEDLKPLSLINKQMMIVHTFFIALTVFLMGLFCFLFADEIVETKLGTAISFGFGFFWLCRLFIQFFGYSPALWKGKLFETIAHVLFTLFWIYLTIVFFLTAFSN